LRLAAKIDAVDVDCFETTIKLHLEHPLIEYFGEIDEREKDELLSLANAPVSWPGCLMLHEITILTGCKFKICESTVEVWTWLSGATLETLG